MNKYYRATNISGQELELQIFRADGSIIMDTMAVNEVCYGLNENAANRLKVYEWMGVIKVEEADQFPPNVNWIAEGF